MARTLGSKRKLDGRDRFLVPHVQYLPPSVSLSRSTKQLLVAQRLYDLTHNVCRIVGTLPTAHFDDDIILTEHIVNTLDARTAFLRLLLRRHFSVVPMWFPLADVAR